MGADHSCQFRFVSAGMAENFLNAASKFSDWISDHFGQNPKLRLKILKFARNGEISVFKKREKNKEKDQWRREEEEE